MDDRLLSDSLRRRATVFALVVAFLDSIGAGLIIPVVPPLIKEVGHMDIGDAAQIAGILFALHSLVLFSNP